MAILDLTRGSTGVAERHEEALAERGRRVVRAVLIGRPRQEIYDFWRDFANLPGVMHHLERVEMLEGNRSRWVAHAPRIAGRSVQRSRAPTTASRPTC